ncbi:MAG: rod shape-determining protein MreD [Peptostreptococcaceae bacterium]|jgi:rod shape-determining protein MreD|nr:rod shape-determining protein MreD [Peptostreptococcaceae bacterium]
MRILINILIAIILIIFQNSIINYTPINIDLLLCYMVYISIYSESYENIVLAIFFGFLKDLSVENYFGITSFIWFFISYIIYKLKDRIFKDSELSIIFIITFSTLFQEFMYLIFLNEYQKNILQEGINLGFLIIFNIVFATILNIKRMRKQTKPFSKRMR